MWEQINVKKGKFLKTSDLSKRSQMKHRKRKSAEKVTDYRKNAIRNIKEQN